MLLLHDADYYSDAGLVARDGRRAAARSSSAIAEAGLAVDVAG